MTCSAATPILTEQEIEERLTRLAGWARAENWIEKKYEFKNFLRAMLFVNAIANVPELMSHHPDMTRTASWRRWTRISVSWR